MGLHNGFVQQILAEPNEMKKVLFSIEKFSDIGHSEYGGTSGDR